MSYTRSVDATTDVFHRTLPAHDGAIDRIVRIFVVHNIVDLESGNPRCDNAGRVFAGLAVKDNLWFQQHTEMTLLQGGSFIPSFEGVQPRTRRIGIGIREDVLQTTSGVSGTERLSKHLHRLCDTFGMRLLDFDGSPRYWLGLFLNLLIPNKFYSSKSKMSDVKICYTNDLPRRKLVFESSP
jgi:hypothetical protein